MREVTVELAERSYPIVIGEGALAASADRLQGVIGRGTAIIVADDTVWGLHEDAMRAVLPDAPVVTVPSGEATKCWAQFERVSEALLAAGVGRDGTVVAFGGGVTGDLAGFCAATLRRGCRFVQVPTTLLAMVDSSVGGKTAINTAAGKNLVGAFHQPGLVIADTGFLRTLPEREFRAGLAEVIKAAVLAGERPVMRVNKWLASAFWDDLSDGRNHDPDGFTQIIEASIALKAEIVADDEREAGRRALLNLGHTFGHAIEAVYGFDGRVLHGEAVALGMCMASRFQQPPLVFTEEEIEYFKTRPPSRYMDPGSLGLIEATVVGAKLPMYLDALPSESGLTADALLAAMYQDKKVEGGALTLILPRALGDVYVAKGVPGDRVRDFLQKELDDA